MPEGYHHLTYEERCQIYALMQSGLSQAAIARQLGVHRSTIKRELDRNTGARSYRFKRAQEKASQKRKTASCAPRKMKPDLVKLIEEKLTQEQWSPDQISGWLMKNGAAAISPSASTSMSGKTRKTAEPFMSSCATAVKNTTSVRAKPQVVA